MRGRILPGGRGLKQYLKTKDGRGNKFRVQTSSDASRPHLWLFTEQITGQHLGNDIPAALHLDRRSARMLRDALGKWLVDISADEPTAADLLAGGGA